MSAAPKMGRGALWFSPVVLVPAAFLAAIPWLKTIGQPAALLITAAVVVFVMTYANYLSFRAQRRLDEVQKAGAAFAAQWGAPAGQVAFGLLLVLPPFKDFAAAAVGRFANHPGMTADGTVVVLSLALGFCAIVLLQGVGTAVVHAIWWTARR